MARNETVGELSTWHYSTRTNVQLTGEYERVFVRLREVQCPLEPTTHDASINPWLCDAKDSGQGLQRLVLPTKAR